MSDLLREAVTEYFGPRCPDFDEDCICCRAWAQFDAVVHDHDDIDTMIGMAEDAADEAYHS